MDDLASRRLAALARYDVMDTPPEPAFDEVAALAAKLCDVPIAVVNLIGGGRQFFKAEVGLGVRETPLESSFCAKAILEEDFLLVPDATCDHRFDGNPLVVNEPHLRFYALDVSRWERQHCVGQCPSMPPHLCRSSFISRSLAAGVPLPADRDQVRWYRPCRRNG